MLKLKNKIEFENNLWIAEVDASTFNSSQEERIKAVTDIASITKGRLGFKGNDRRRLYNQLLTENAGNPSTPFEFVPIVYLYDSVYFIKENLVLRGNIVDFDNKLLFSNLRIKQLNKSSLTELNQIDFSKYYKNFKIIVGKVPFKVISHLVRHRAFSFLVESSRNKKYLNEVEFWYPSWWNDDMINYYKNNKDVYELERLKSYVNNKYIKPEEATMELSDRRLVLFAIAGWKQDEFGWDNLFAVRDNKSTMSITSIVVNNIKKLIYNKYEK